MIYNYLVFVIIGFVIGWIVGWMVRGDENRRYHTRRSMAGMALAPLPPARQTVVGWIPRGRAELDQGLTADDALPLKDGSAI